MKFSCHKNIWTQSRVFPYCCLAMGGKSYHKKAIVHTCGRILEGKKSHVGKWILFSRKFPHNFAIFFFRDFFRTTLPRDPYGGGGSCNLVKAMKGGKYWNYQTPPMVENTHKLSYKDWGERFQIKTPWFYFALKKKFVRSSNKCIVSAF